MAENLEDEIQEYHIPFESKTTGSGGNKTPGSGGDKTTGSGGNKTPGSGGNCIGIFTDCIAQAIETNKLNLLLNIQINSNGDVSVNVFGNKKTKTPGSLAKERVTKDNSNKNLKEVIENDKKDEPTETLPVAPSQEKATNKPNSKK